MPNLMPVREELLRHNLSVRSIAYSKLIAAYFVGSQFCSAR